MISKEIVGFMAGILIAISLLPQVIKAIRTHSTSDISITWMLINLLGQILWLVYGILINSTALYSMSGVTLIMATILLFLKLKFDAENKRLG